MLMRHGGKIQWSRELLLAEAASHRTVHYCVYVNQLRHSEEVSMQKIRGFYVVIVVLADAVGSTST